MQKPSDQWKKLRCAALERARRNMIEPLEVVHLALLGASALYLAGFLRLNLFAQTDEFSWASGAFVLVAATAGLLVPVLTGSVLTLRFADRRLARLIGG
ncbi:hypothetical protein [uncultured Tateyamaria sp.]|uniref:hypothetical protein n=1 Tax=uncultured Tateyamaria sp. TaxID=455651 RepID=UPI0026152F7A|nr:hypothetical protein [uncultured Tateyamaria sp.]